MVVVLGGGVTGLATGIATGGQILEAEAGPGGLCRSFDARGYRFERGGGHWIFGRDPDVLALLDACAPLTRHERRSAVHFFDRDLVVPFPVQHHVDALGAETAARVAAESPRSHAVPLTLRDWLLDEFGPTLCDAFFFPFHERYTAGLYREVAPQDGYKSPGIGAPSAGYNPTFVYPTAGLDTLTRALADQCSRVEYGARASAISVDDKTVTCTDGRVFAYDTLASTLPLNETLRLAGVEIEAPPDPYTSVLVVNVGAQRGPKCPAEHWIYVPVSASGLHRIGVYSNVDESFLPVAARGRNDRVAIYAEVAFLGGQRLAPARESEIVSAVIAELGAMGYIGAVDVVDHSWIDVAYTWRRPASPWVADACAALEAHGVHPVGRYGRWRFQGIVDSVRDGLHFDASVRT